MFQDIEGESSLGLSDSRWEYVRPKQLEVLVFQACIIAPTPPQMVYKYSSRVNNGELITEPVPPMLHHIVGARSSIMT